VLGHKRKQNAVAGVEGFNFAVVHKYVTATAQKADIELAVSQRASKNQHWIETFSLQIKFEIYLVYFQTRFGIFVERRVDNTDIHYISRSHR